MNFSIRCIVVFMLVFIDTMATVKKITTVGFSSLAPRMKPVGMPPENEKVILPLHLALPVGVTNLTKRAIFLKYGFASSDG